MKLFKNNKQEITGSSLNRIKKLPDSELITWLDVLIMDLGSRFDAWRFRDQPMSDIDSAIEVITEVWKEIKVREHGQNPS